LPITLESYFWHSVSLKLHGPLLSACVVQRLEERLSIFVAALGFPRPANDAIQSRAAPCASVPADGPLLPRDAVPLFVLGPEARYRR
jgi:hypothetical protein